MSTTVQQFIDQVRSVHPAFSRYMVPDQALADFATREQRRLMSLALLRDRSYLAQSLPILFDLMNADLDAPGVAGIGTTGGMPGVIEDGVAFVGQNTTGSAVTVLDGTVYVDDTPVASATATTLVGVGVAWTTNAYVNAIVRIVGGTGANTSARVVASNTSTTVTVTAAWDETPDSTSIFRIVEPVQTLDGTVGMVTDLPAVTQQLGYLVKLNAQGVPFIDYATPLIGHVGRGVPLPPFFAVLGGTVRFRDADAQSDFGAVPFTLVAEAARYNAARWPAGFLRGTSLHLIGQRADWQPVESIDLTYVPVPPAFTSRSDVFLLPDTALPVLAAKGALFAASRIAGVDGVPQPPMAQLAADAAEAETSFLTTITLSKRARIGRVRPAG